MAIAESLAFRAADILRLPFDLGSTEPFVPGAFPLLFLFPARMLAMPLALSLLFLLGAASTGISTGGPRSWLSSFSNDRILSLMSAARRSCCGVRFVIEFMYRPELAAQPKEVKLRKRLAAVTYRFPGQRL